MSVLESRIGFQGNSLLKFFESSVCHVRLNVGCVDSWNIATKHGRVGGESYCCIIAQIRTRTIVAP